MGVTIYDIAEQAGVSIATVSRVFNNHTRVSEATRRRVLRVAAELGYQPHVSAQSLARRKTHLIAAVIPVLSNFFYMEVIRGMQDAVAESDFDLLLYAAPSPQEIDSQLERALQKGRADGLLLLSTPLTEAYRNRLKSARGSIVLVDAADPDFDSVSVDNVKGGYMATRYLIDLGYERIAHITVAPEPPPAVQRRQGYEQALREAGRSVDPALIAASGRKPYGFVEEAGYEAMRQLLERDERPDAVFVASDIQALGALKALQEAGLQVPRDMGLVGFDDIVVSKYVGLTTLRQPMYEMGRIAIEKLLSRLKHPERSVSHTVFSPRLVVRRTCRSRAVREVSGMSDR
ncbi:LacI family transcriptional regulator [Rhodocaloribacter litoris]|uniref:LacI family DNA-binding transcriptional regulator n=1 Tax=Rhodocaloribacter litoris TaxID=2558931 RepID=UPI00141DB3DF|nr:LacI family DNA-binding transcriptional regulator [Rhodocaloribacter litoris]QXD16443.1 LacI family transcriptional regulator [Rhodocaloribacter litoris]